MRLVKRDARRWDIIDARSNLEHIPGLRYDSLGETLSGSVDAIAVACKRLGLEPPRNVLPDTPSQVGSLRPYQLEGVGRLSALLREHGAAILGDEMGLGKTRQAITLASVLSEGRVFVACPASVRETWRKELADEYVAILGPPSNTYYRKDWARAGDAKWVVSSYELADMAHEAMGWVQPSLLIMDEAHAHLRGRKSDRSQTLLEIGRMARYRLLLSGTPIADRPRDAWRLLNIMFGSNRMGSAWDFDEAYCSVEEGAHGGRNNEGSQRLDELRLRLSYYQVRRLKSEVLPDLPAKTRQVIWCEDRFKSAVEQAVMAGRFLLLTYHVAEAARLAAAINKAGVPAFLITGAVSHPERVLRIAQAQRVGGGVVATIDSTSTGVDGLQHIASTGIMHELDSMPMKTLQAEDRLHRLGQSGNVHWIYLLEQSSGQHRRVAKVLEKLENLAALQGGGEGLKAALTGRVESDEELARRLYEEMSDDS